MTYSGAPDECSYCYVWGAGIVRLDSDGNCPEKESHYTFGPMSHFGDAPPSDEKIDALNCARCLPNPDNMAHDVIVVPASRRPAGGGAVTGASRYAVGMDTPGPDATPAGATEAPGDRLDMLLAGEKFDAHFRVPRTLWDEWGRLLGDVGGRRTGGRTPHLLAFIEREVRRLLAEEAVRGGAR